MSQGDVLIVYALQSWPVRGSIRDHLGSFARHSGARCHYVNLSVRRPPRWLLSADFDLVVFHTSFLSHLRWDPATGERLLERAAPLRDLAATKAALPQDEFLRSEAINAFINEFGVDVVLSVADASQWPLIYDTVDRDRVRFSTVLTGYLLDESVARAEAIAAQTPDAGHRRRLPRLHAPAWLGTPGPIEDGHRRHRRGRRPRARPRGRRLHPRRGHPLRRRLAALPGPQPLHAGRRGRGQRPRSRRLGPRLHRGPRGGASRGELRGARGGLLPGPRRRAAARGDLAAPPRGVRDADLPGPRERPLQRDPRGRPPLRGARARPLQPRGRAGHHRVRGAARGRYGARGPRGRRRLGPVQLRGLRGARRTRVRARGGRRGTPGPNHGRGCWPRAPPTAPRGSASAGSRCGARGRSRPGSRSARRLGAALPGRVRGLVRRLLGQS